jgi:hypothetical protein
MRTVASISPQKPPQVLQGDQKDQKREEEEAQVVDQGLLLGPDAEEAGEEEEEDPPPVQGGDGQEVEEGQGEVDGGGELYQAEKPLLGRPARLGYEANGPHHAAIGVPRKRAKKPPHQGPDHGGPKGQGAARRQGQALEEAHLAVGHLRLVDHPQLLHPLPPGEAKGELPPLPEDGQGVGARYLDGLNLLGAPQGFAVHRHKDVPGLEPGPLRHAPRQDLQDHRPPRGLRHPLGAEEVGQEHPGQEDVHEDARHQDEELAQKGQGVVSPAPLLGEEALNVGVPS